MKTLKITGKTIEWTAISILWLVVLYIVAIYSFGLGVLVYIPGSIWLLATGRSEKQKGKKPAKPFDYSFRPPGYGQQRDIVWPIQPYLTNGYLAEIERDGIYEVVSIHSVVRPNHDFNKSHLHLRASHGLASVQPLPHTSELR